MKRSTIIGISALTAAIIAVPMAASAANGGAWLLGRSNYESAVTTVTNSAGSALSLNSKSGYAPFRVNRTTKVPNLNSDLVDGYSASAFAMRSGKVGTVTDHNSGDAYGPVCPAGTVAVGGGGLAAYDAVQYNGPDFNASGTSLVFIPNSWVIIDTLGYVVPSFVTCYSPSGAAVPGASASMPNPYAGLSAMAASGTTAPRHVAGNLKASVAK